MTDHDVMNEARYSRLYKQNKTAYIKLKYGSQLGGAISASASTSTHPDVLTISALASDYPFKRKTQTADEIWRMYENLKSYTLSFVSNPAEYGIRNIGKSVEPAKLLYRGEPVLVEVSDQNYDLYDNISDYFQEAVRIMCKRSDQTITPYEYWNQHKDEIQKIGSGSVKAQREALYKRYSECTTFKPSLLVGFVKFLFESYADYSVRILDISSGWGDRLIGALACADSYTGTDPNTDLQPGYAEIIKFFNGNPAKFKVVPTKFQDADLPAKSFDLVFSSPPYFKLEEYSGVIYTETKAQWLEHFMFRSMDKAAKCLVRNGYMVININDSPVKQKDTDADAEDHYVTDILNHNMSSMIYLGCVSQFNSNRPVYNSAQPFWIWKKVKLPKINELNPDVKIETLTYIDTDMDTSDMSSNMSSSASDSSVSEQLESEQSEQSDAMSEPNTSGISYQVVRDDLLMGGTKQRIVLELFDQIIRDGYNGIVYPGPSNGYAQIVLALGAKLKKSAAIILIPKVRPVTAQTQLALQLGASVLEYENEQGRLKNLKMIGADIAAERNMHMPALGFGGDMFKTLMTQALRSRLPIDLNEPRDIWVVGGSGTLALTLYDLFPNSTINVVQVGKPIDWSFEGLDRAKLYIAPQKLGQDVTGSDIPPYPSLASYDAKVWQFVRKRIDPNNRTLIWNVAGPVSLF